jgi:pyruvate kinase
VRRTKIVATIGPASSEPDILVRMIEAGLDVARLNFSHGDFATHAETAERIRKAAETAGREIAILQDLPGPKLRIGQVENGIASLHTGSRLTLVCGVNDIGNEHRISVSWAGLPEAVNVGDVIYLSDGKIRLRVAAIRRGEAEIDTVIEVGGDVASRQGLNIPGSTKGLQSVPAADLEMLKFGESLGVDLVALSFIRSAADLTGVRAHTRLPLIAKIEKPQAVDNAEEIIRAADCVMVARGDLGIELPIEEVPLAQKHLLRLAGKLGRPAITATQMLDSMVSSPRPTRAEASDVANAIFDGTDAVMLSQETAIGQYPVETIAMMASIAQRTEHDLPYAEWNEGRLRRDARDPAYTIAHSACMAAQELHVEAIVTPTSTGRTARLVSAYRPTVPVLALSSDIATVRRCNLMWGVQAAWREPRHDADAMITVAAKRVVELGWVKPGARVVITSGMPGVPGTTSLMQVQRV